MGGCNDIGCLPTEECVISSDACSLVNAMAKIAAAINMQKEVWRQHLFFVFVSSSFRYKRFL
ncbi:hypothetical protein DOY81_013693 [Sarcophaga bullata]|nr:hypothetical protein DOY81_013693 [Sarcophaga bullata]